MRNDPAILLRAKRGERRALGWIVRQNAGLVRVTARKYGGLADYEDLVAAGQLGVIRATRRFEEDGDMPFRVFCRRCVEQAMRAEIKRAEVIRSPRDSEIPVTFVSLDETLDDGEGGTFTLHDVIADESIVPADEVVGRKEVLEELVELPPRERATLVLTYGLGNHVDHTADEAAKVLGWSEQVFRKLRKRGLRMLRDRMGEEIDWAD